MRRCVLAVMVSVLGIFSFPPESAAADYRIPLESPNRMILRGVEAQPTTYTGKRAIRIVEQVQGGFDGYALAIVPGPAFRDGAIDVEVAGRPRPGSFEGARGFAGIAFRVAPDAGAFECFYLRPTNGRANDQLRRNHATQYISHPGFPFDRLRKEAPGAYESYVDLQPGVWTHMRIEVAGVGAKLFVNRSKQPVLIVNDLKQGDSSGGLALWIGDGTEAFFSSLQVTAVDQ